MDGNPDLHIGSSFESFLEEEGTLDAADALAVRRVAAWESAQEAARGKAPGRSRPQTGAAGDTDGTGGPG
jgi:hypothetical protein